VVPVRVLRLSKMAAVGLAVLSGVVASAVQGGAELGAGLEVGADLAGWFLAALELGGSRAESVAELARRSGLAAERLLFDQPVAAIFCDFGATLGG
jgi:hypothetical protein